MKYRPKVSMLGRSRVFELESCEFEHWSGYLLSFMVFDHIQRELHSIQYQYQHLTESNDVVVVRRRSHKGAVNEHNECKACSASSEPYVCLAGSEYLGIKQ
jgi:hypothetical protein